MHTRRRKPQWEAAEMGQSSQSGEGVGGRQSLGQRSVKGSEVSAIFSSAENWYSLGAGLGHKLTGPSGSCWAPSETASQQHNGNATQVRTLVR